MESTGRYPRLVTFACSVIAVSALYLARDVLAPFALALLISFLLAPLVVRLQRSGVNRVLAVFCAVLFAFVLTGALAWLVAGQARELAADLPVYRENIRAKIEAVREFFQRPLQTARDTVADLGAAAVAPADGSPKAREPVLVRVVDVENGPFDILQRYLAPSAQILTTAAMVLLFAFVMLLRREDLRDRFIRLVGNGEIYVATQALDEASKRVSSYLARQFGVNALQGAVLGLGLTLLHVPNALLWGLLATLLRFVPYVGTWIAALFPVLLTLAISHGWQMPVYVALLFVVVELLVNMVVEPWFYGVGAGVTPLGILISTLFWTWLWGPVGLVLATPLTACLVVLGKHVPQLQFLHVLLGDTLVLAAPERLYQRLIAGDADEAWNVVRAELAEQPLWVVYDATVLPALALAEADRQRGILERDVEARIDESLEMILSEAAERPDPPASKTAARDTAGADRDARAVDWERSAGSGSQPLGLHVLCLPVRNATDARAATALAQVLRRDGCACDLVPLAELVSEILDRIERAPPDLVFLSAVPPSRFLRVRYLCKRIAARFPELDVVVGMWTLALNANELEGRVPSGPHVHFVPTLRAARDLVRQIGPALVLQRRDETQARVRPAS